MSREVRRELEVRYRDNPPVRAMSRQLSSWAFHLSWGRGASYISSLSVGGGRCPGAASGVWQILRVLGLAGSTKFSEDFGLNPATWGLGRG